MVRKICVFVGSRANYSSIKSAMTAIKNHPELELQVVLGASAILEKYGAVRNLIQKDGFEITRAVYMNVEGENNLAMAKSTGLGILEMATAFEELKPDFVIVVGDRYEIMSPAVAAAYMNIPLVHTMGGEVTGTIDESIRHAVTKLAHVHFPANKDSGERIKRLGELEENIHVVGCPRIDLVNEIMQKGLENLDNLCQEFGGVGSYVDVNKPFLLVSQHPVTTEYDKAESQIYETLKALEELNLQTIMLWPNSDAGTDGISKGIRKYRESHPDNKIHLFKNLPTNVYINLMLRTICLIGNSSSGIREGEFMGTPCVNIGTRQSGRERGENVIDVDYNRVQIKDAVLRQQQHGRYESKSIYGDGKAGIRIADILASASVDIQKRITY